MRDFKVYQASGYLTKLVTDASDVRKEYEEISGSLVQFDTPISAPLASLMVDINLVQSGIGDPSPTNVRPITGWTGCEVTRTGSNLYSRENGEYNVPVYSTDGSSASYPDVNAVWIPVKPNTNYIVIAKQNDVLFYIRWIECDNNKGFIYRATYNSTNQTAHFTTHSNTEWLEIAVNQYGTSQISENDWEICIKEGADTTYEPYSGATLSVTFPDSAGTVYGGTVDLVSGLLTVDRGIITYNGSDITFEYGSFYGMPCRSTTISNFKRPSSSTSLSGIKSNYLKEIKQASTWGVVGTFSATTVDSRLYICIDNSIDSQNALNQYLAEHPLTFCYKLATPIEIQLTPQEIRTLAGENNVWGDGNIEMTYKAQSS